MGQQLARIVALAISEDDCAGGSAGLHADRRVFDDKASRRIGAQRAGGHQIDIGRGLGLLDHVGTEEPGRLPVGRLKTMQQTGRAKRQAHLGAIATRGHRDGNAAGGQDIKHMDDACDSDHLRRQRGIAACQIGVGPACRQGFAELRFDDPDVLAQGLAHEELGGIVLGER